MSKSPWWMFDGREEHAEVVLEVTPSLTTWTGRLTPSGEALVEWCAETGTVIPEVPAPRGNLLKPFALYAQKYPQEAAALWRRYAASLELA